MKRRRRRKGKPGNKGNGMGPFQEWTPIARGTRTKSKEENRRQADQKQKERGWENA